MTVKELIKKLEEYPSEAFILIEDKYEGTVRKVGFVRNSKRFFMEDLEAIPVIEVEKPVFEVIDSNNNIELNSKILYKIINETN